MNTKLVARVTRALITLVLVLSVVWTPNMNAKADWPFPVFMLNISNDSSWRGLDAWNWPLGSKVTLTVDDPNTLQNPDYTEVQTMGIPNPGQTTISHAMYMQDYDLEEHFEGHPGFTITLSDGTQTKTMIVPLLSITGYDLDADTVSGVTDRFVKIEISTCANEDCSEMVDHYITADNNGDWTADFSGIYDLQPGDSVEPVFYDNDWDHMVLRDWSVPNPIFQVAPFVPGEMLSNLVGGDGWESGSRVTLKIDDPTNGTGWDYDDWLIVPSDGECIPEFYQICFQPDPAEFTIRAGQYIELSDGVNIKTHVVTQLRITWVDFELDRIGGIADAGIPFDVPLSAFNGGNALRHVIPNLDGSWYANFSQPGILPDEQDVFDMQSGGYQVIVPEQCDGDGECTKQWGPSGIPSFEVLFPAGKIEVHSWGPGAELVLTADDLHTSQNPDYTDTNMVNFDEWDHFKTYARFFMPEKLKSQRGQLITATDGHSTISYKVANLFVNSANIESNRIFGMADPDGVVEVQACNQDDCVFRRVASDNAGNWMVDFSVVGESDEEQVLLDIRPGVYIEVRQSDNQWGTTVLGWWVPANQAPQIMTLAMPITPVQLGQSINAAIEFSDSDVGDTHTVIWNWGDGSTNAAPATVPSVTTSHTYTSAGVYTVTATITDAAGEADTETFQYVVVYDPNGGYVTGGGWITSPLGAYTPDPSLTGKATFGFVSKYQKGANVPTGNTEFQFKIADLNFKSTSYDWLVVTGSDYAMFKGVGTINNEGIYKFMIWAGDNDPDTFRIKIWYEEGDNEIVVYDNGMDQEIGGGSIVVHTAK